MTSSNETIQAMVVSHECCGSCSGDCSGLQALARAREDAFFQRLDDKLIGELRTSLGLPAAGNGGGNEYPRQPDGRGTGYAGSHCELTWFALGGLIAIR